MRRLILTAATREGPIVHGQPLRMRLVLRERLQDFVAYYDRCGYPYLNDR
jgi:hypothetical protein